ELDIPDLAASYRKTIVDILTSKFIAAAKETGAKTLVLAGGVSANSELRRRMTSNCKKEGYELYFPPLSLCGDNAEMIGAQGYYEYLNGTVAGLDLNARASLSIEQNYSNF
ncbi:MAG: tRNA (adenosine(37)-N6)-threonylcarbamoyltransferase complex transferase subunit TsaD, partial [Clostridia bacterium]|nr:tRNA (adenosine(37)-N6)-threonylcarbamoyltransferase complex transferase subunit TsaD [Clostridia bacterium]